MDTNQEQELINPADEDLELRDDEEDDADDDEEESSTDQDTASQSITIGGQDYTIEELTARLAEQSKEAPEDEASDESIPSVEDILSEIDGYDTEFATDNERALASMVAEQRHAILQLVQAVKPIVQTHRSTVEERTAAAELAQATGKTTEEALAAYKAANGDKVKAAVALSQSKPAASKEVRKVKVAPGDRSQRTDGAKSDLDILREAEEMAANIRG